MIVSQTPLRISFFSGGSDLPSFYQYEDGAALSVTIDKFIYVCTHETPYTGIKTMFDDVSINTSFEGMQLGIAREVMLNNYTKHPQITIASMSDIKTKGSGLGSSSAFTVGLIKNVLAHCKLSISKLNLAEEAFNIEHNFCKYPVGKQDQYAAAFGGFNLFEFKQNGYVTRTELPLSDKILEFQNRLLLVCSGRGRNGNSILGEQEKAVLDKEKFNLIKAGRNKAYLAFDQLKVGNIDNIGEMLHQAWIDKKKIVSSISDVYFDDIYEKAINAGAIGGKLLGAGGGGFFIFYVPLDKKEKVINTFKNTECTVYQFKFTEEGSKIIL